MFTPKVMEVPHPVWPTDRDEFGIESEFEYIDFAKLSKASMPELKIKDDREKKR